MDDNKDKLDELSKKLEILLQKQNEFSRDIVDLKNELYQLQYAKPTEDEALEKAETHSPEVIPENNPEIKSANVTDLSDPDKAKVVYDLHTDDPKPIETPPKQRKKSKVTFFEIDKGKKTNAKEEPLRPIIEQKIGQGKRSSSFPKVGMDLEKFIGENLISKIGIIITIIGVAIGAKWGIDNDLITPLARIIFGYLMGLGLLGFGMKLKKKYEAFSAVLVSGAISILYFITFAAYSFYELIPQTMAFGLMVIFTVFSVVAALNYNRQIIAILGSIGAYAVPYLLSDGSGNIAVLFSYTAIINLGILFVCVKKYWKPLYILSFVLTWLIFTTWYIFDYYGDEKFTLALTFLTVFFVQFYITFLAYKLIKKEKYTRWDIVFLLLNSFIFYGFGYNILIDNELGSQLLGVFTLVNAVIHFITASIIYRQKLGDKNLFYLVAGLVLVFITIAIPVQLDGNWVTLMWCGEAAILFWIGRSKGVSIYEKISYPLMILATFSMLEDWSMSYFSFIIDTKINPLFNIYFLTSILFSATFGFITYIGWKNKNSELTRQDNSIFSLLSFLPPALFLFGLFASFYLEISLFWDNLYNNSIIEIQQNAGEYSSQIGNYDLERFKRIWLVIYSLTFVSILGWINMLKIKSKNLGVVNIFLILIAILAYFTTGLYELSELRESYLSQNSSELFNRSSFNLHFRYVSVIFVAITMFTLHKYLRKDFIEGNFKVGFEFLLHGTILWFASSELLHWMDIYNSSQSYKLGLSILWGVYSLYLISLGIWKNKQYLRIGAIVLFGLTLIKLFFYDIAHLNTISKTIVFVSLGILLLIISFLYNKFKHRIADEKVQ